MKNLDLLIDKAQQAYECAVSSYTLDDMMNGNPQKDAVVEKCLDSLDRLVRTKAVRVEAARIKNNFSN